MKIVHGLTATYPGDVTHIVDEVKGPNTVGEFFVAIQADYDDGKTRVKFKQLPDFKAVQQ